MCVVCCERKHQGPERDVMNVKRVPPYLLVPPYVLLMLPVLFSCFKIMKFDKFMFYLVF